MATPRQVKKAARQAEQLHEEAYRAEDAEPPADAGAAAPVEPAPAEAVETPAEPAPEPVAEEPAPAPEHKVEDWEQKYRVLQGKYNAEVPRLARETRELKEQLEARAQILSSLERVQEEKAATPPQVPSTTTGVTNEEREEYGADFLDVVSRQAQAALAPQLQELQKHLQQMNAGFSGVNQRLQQSDQERVFAYLDAHVPDWEQVNNADEFLMWLEQRDRYTGRSRRDLLAEAYQQFDAPRVAAFFTDYQQEHAAVTPAPEPPPPPADSGSGKVPLTQLVAPGTPREGAGAAGAQDGKRMWSQGEIAAFYDDVQKGRYRDDPASKLAIEKDIVAAGREGRIRG